MRDVKGYERRGLRPYRFPPKDRERREELSPERVTPVAEKSDRELVHAWPGKGEEKLPQATSCGWPGAMRAAPLHE